MSKQPRPCEPDDERRKLVRAVAVAIAEFMHDDPRSLAAHLQAARLLVRHGPLRGSAVGDFVVHAGKRRRPSVGDQK